jgi:predicted AAA+ superfamily ATPase
LDTENVDLFISGSSAALLSREVATSMRGRAMEALVHPFSFREYLRHVGSEPDTTPDRLPKAGRSALEKHLRTYLRHGGFPEAQGADSRDRRDLLRSYIDVALLRDVVERHGVSQPVALRWMVRQLLSNAGGSFSISKFYHDLKSQGFRIRKDTLHEYLAYLQDAFIVRTLFVATDSERRRMVNPRKAYPVDPGFVALFESSSSGHMGHCLETCVLLELERRGADIAYVKTANGFEVDFLARYPNGELELIQVCANLDDPATRDREFRALLDAKSEHRGASLHLVALDLPSALHTPQDVAVHLASNWFIS